MSNPILTVDLVCSSYQFRSPRGYYGCWTVRVHLDGRIFYHDHEFGKSGTRGSVPDEQHLAEKLAERIRQTNPGLAHFEKSSHWTDMDACYSADPETGELIQRRDGSALRSWQRDQDLRKARAAEVAA